MKVYNSDGEEIWSTNGNGWTATVGYRKDTYNLYLEKGIYYMQVKGDSDIYGNKSTGKYEIKTAFVSSNTTFDGDDNSFANAKPISWRENYIGQISINDDFDTYKFIVPTGMKVPISMTSYMRYYCIRIYDPDGREVGYVGNKEWDSKVGYRKDTLSIVLSAGTYYIQVKGDSDIYGNKSTGKYVFSIGTEATEEAYKNQNKQKDSKEKTTKKNKADQTANSSNKPSKLKKVTKVAVTKKRKALKLKWKKVSGAIGYQVCYSTSLRFKKKNTQETSGTTITLKKLKAKKSYYVRIRAFSIVDGVRKYGNYSKVLKRKTK